MMRGTLLFFAAAGLFAQQNDRARELDRVAEVATAMVDGDVCLRIQTARSARMLLEQDPRDPWKASDNFDVEDAAFIQTKKTLMRLARLCPEAGGPRTQAGTELVAGDLRGGPRQLHVGDRGVRTAGAHAALVVRRSLHPPADSPQHGAFADLRGDVPG